MIGYAQKSSYFAGLGIVLNIVSWIYDLIWSIALLSIRLGLLGANRKAWLKNRKLDAKDISTAHTRVAQVLYCCASLGEYERIAPFISAEIVANVQKQEVSFFSPSGYLQVDRSTNLGTAWSYLPTDRKKDVSSFFGSREVKLVLISSNMIWPHFICHLITHQIPYYFIGSSWHGSSWYKRAGHRLLSQYLKMARKIFVIDDITKQYLGSLGVTDVHVSGDPRVDQIMAKPTGEIRQEFKRWASDSPLFVCGSTHTDDERILYSIIEKITKKGWKVLIAPHELNDSRLSQIQRQLSDWIDYTTMTKSDDNPVCILNQWGLLNSVYKLGKVAYIGGGFSGGGIHNIIEPAASGCDILIGPNYHKFPEARQLDRHHALTVIKDQKDLSAYFAQYPSGRENRSVTIKNYIENQQGATEKIITAINLDQGEF